MINNIIEKLERPIAFVTMCADPIHYGHINILNEAQKYGVVLVGLMTDEAISSYKSPPLMNFRQRRVIVDSLKMVSGIIAIESLEHYVQVVSDYRIEFFVHGDDWKKGIQAPFRKKLINIMSSWGGKVVDAPYTKRISSKMIKDTL